MFPSLTENDSFLKRIPGKRIYNMLSLDLKNIATFIKINNQEKSKSIIQDFAQLINLKTSNRLQSIAKQLAQIGKFYLLQSKQGLFRPGDIANKYYIILNGSIGILMQQQLTMYQCGEGFGDEQFYLEQKFRLGYAFQVSVEPTLICQISKQDYNRIFAQKIQLITKYEQILRNNCTFFSDLPKNKIKLILKDSQIFTLKKNEILFERYQDVKGIYVMLEGKARQFRQIKYKTKNKLLDQFLKQVKDFKEYVKMYEQLRQVITVKQKIIQHLPFAVLGLDQIQNLKNRRQSKIQIIKLSKIIYIPLMVFQRYLTSQLNSSNIKVSNSQKKGLEQRNLNVSSNKIKNYKSQRHHTLQQYQNNSHRMNTFIPKNKFAFDE